MSLSETARARLAAIASVLIPGGAGQPNAAALALHLGPVDTVLRIDPTRLAPLQGFLRREGSVDSLDGIEMMAQADPDGFHALSVVLANAYFKNEQYQEAAELYREVAEGDHQRTIPLALFNLGQAQYRQGELEAALKTFATVRERFGVDHPEIKTRAEEASALINHQIAHKR